MIGCVEVRHELSVRKLRKLMAAKGWDEVILAGFAKVSPKTVKDLLSGASGGQVATLLKIADALGVEDLNELFDRLG